MTSRGHSQAKRSRKEEPDRSDEQLKGKPTYLTYGDDHEHDQGDHGDADAADAEPAEATGDE